MTNTEKQAKLTEFRTQAKDLQARLGFLTLQVRQASSEIQKIKTILEFQEAQYAALERSAVEPDPETAKAE